MYEDLNNRGERWCDITRDNFQDVIKLLVFDDSDKETTNNQ